MSLISFSPFQRSLPRIPTSDDLTNLKIEADRMRRIILDKKQQIQILELEAAKFDELKILMRDVLADLQSKGEIQFFQEYQNPEDIPLMDPQKYLKAIRSSISALLDKHMILSQRYEVALKNQCFLQQQDIANAQRVLDEEKAKLQFAQEQFDHQKKLVDIVSDQKMLLQRTIALTQESVERHRQQNEETIQDFKEKIEQKASRISKMKERNVKIEQEHEENIREIEQQTKEEEQNLSAHEELLSQKANILEELRKLAYDQSCLISDLDKAKAELSLVQSKNDSYLSNLKTHQLLAAERENERLRSLLKTEKKRSESSLESQIKKTKQLEEYLERITQETKDINEQISDTESKLQALAMRIPDFHQIEQVLDQVSKTAQKDKSEILKTQYMLDEIRDRNRLIEQQECYESKLRTEQLLQKLADPRYDE